MNRRRLLQSALPLAALGASGCIGSFTLTKKVLNWNRNFGSPIVSEVVFLIFIFFPIYETTIFIDAVLLNTIEFVTGSNPLGAVETDGEAVAELGRGARLRLRRRGEGVELTLRERDGAESVRVLELDADGARVYDENGLLLASAFATADSGMVVLDGAGRLLASYGAEELARVQAAYDRGGDEAVVDAALELESTR